MTPEYLNQTSYVERFFGETIHIDPKDLEPLFTGTTAEFEGKGSTSEVFKIKNYQTYGYPTVALLKVMRPLGSDLSEKSIQIKRRCFALNCDALEKAEGCHQRVPRLFDKGHLPNGVPAVIEELMDGVRGTNFDNWLRKQPAEKRVIFYKQIGLLTADLNDIGIVHFDPQPQNFGKSDTGRAVMIDFGVSYVSGSPHNLDRFSNFHEARRYAIQQLGKFIYKIENEDPEHTNGSVIGIRNLQRAIEQDRIDDFTDFTVGLQELRAI